MEKWIDKKKKQKQRNKVHSFDTQSCLSESHKHKHGLYDIEITSRSKKLEK